VALAAANLLSKIAFVHMPDGMNGRAAIVCPSIQTAPPSIDCERRLELLMAHGS
jgi:hypothetical protein